MTALAADSFACLSIIKLSSLKLERQTSRDGLDLGDIANYSASYCSRSFIYINSCNSCNNSKDYVTIITPIFQMRNS